MSKLRGYYIILQSYLFFYSVVSLVTAVVSSLESAVVVPLAEVVADSADEVLPTLFFVITISTRLFFARPSSVELSETGSKSEYP